MSKPSMSDVQVLFAVGYRGKLGHTIVRVHKDGPKRVYKDDVLIGEFDNAVMANDFARQKSGFGLKGE
jgi:hypothetical protein